MRYGLRCEPSLRRAIAMSETPGAVPSIENKASDSMQPEEGQIPQIIDAYARRIRSIGRCAREYIQLAEKTCKDWQKSFIEKLKSPEGPDARAAFSDKSFLETLHYHIITPHSDILSQSLLIFGFSAFDAFVGMLLTRLYLDEPNLIYKMEEKTLRVSDLVSCANIEEALAKIIDRDVSSLLRNSYDDQFSKLAERHGVSSLKKFPNWPKFVEAAQRRNLITHCNGVVNSQYMNACRDAQFTLAPEVVSGHQLTADANYVHGALDILYEVGVKLGHTLWRTASPSRIGNSESILTEQLFELLNLEEWSLATIIGEFAVNLPRPKLDIQRRISRINYAQAVKWAGDHVGALKILDEVDWSASIRDLRLGVEVLRENYDNATSLMRQIGKEGELIVEVGYRTWPVFREFRKTPQFAVAFEEIYGQPFAYPQDAGVAANQSPDSCVIEIECSGQCKSDDSTTVNGESQMPSKKPVSEPPKETGAESSKSG